MDGHLVKKTLQENLSTGDDDKKKTLFKSQRCSLRGRCTHQIVVDAQICFLSTPRETSRLTTLAGITISVTVALFLPSLPFLLRNLSPSSCSRPRLRKERQTHFHTNGVRACSPGTRWNCKYFIFAREPRAITPRPLSPRFHSLPFCRCPSFICSPVCLAAAAVRPSCRRSPVQIGLSIIGVKLAQLSLRCQRFVTLLKSSTSSLCIHPEKSCRRASVCGSDDPGHRSDICGSDRPRRVSGYG